MKNFTEFLSEASQFNKKRFEEFLVAIVNGSNDFEWQIIDHESNVTLTGEDDFFSCVRKAKTTTDVGRVYLQGSHPDDDIVLQYNSKKKKLSLG